MKNSKQAAKTAKVTKVAKQDVFVTISQNRGEGKSPYYRKISANSAELGISKTAKNNDKGIDTLCNGIAGHVFYMAEMGKKETSCKLLDMGKPITIQIESPIVELNTATANIQVDLKVSRQKRPARFATAIKFLIQANSMQFGDYVQQAAEIDTLRVSDEAKQKAAKTATKKVAKAAKA